MHGSLEGKVSDEVVLKERGGLSPGFLLLPLLSYRSTDYYMQALWLYYFAAATGGGGGGVGSGSGGFLPVRDDLGRLFDYPFPACALFVVVVVV